MKQSSGLIFANRFLRNKPANVLALCLQVLSFNAQIHNWSSINTGHTLEPGNTALLARGNHVFFFNGSAGTLHRSFNNGTSWDKVPIPSDSSQFNYAHATVTNDSVLYVCGYDGSLFAAGIRTVVKKSVNNGHSWSTHGAGLTGTVIPSHINFFDVSNGLVFVTGTGQTRKFRTTDGGINWSELPNADLTMGMVESSTYFPGGAAVVTGFSNTLKIGRTSNGGSTWTTINHPSSAASQYLQFFDVNNGLLIVNDSLFVTNNGGQGFTAKRKFPFTGQKLGLAMLDLSHGFICTGNAIHYTEDAGLTYSLSYANPTLQLSGIKHSGNYVYASTSSSSTMLRLDVTFLLAGLVQNTVSETGPYPNPTEGLLHLGAQFPNAYYRLCNLAGQVVKSGKAAGQTIDLSELAKGIYILHLPENNVRVRVVKI